MRFVIFGAGAIGGVVGARLHQGGFDVGRYRPGIDGRCEQVTAALAASHFISRPAPDVMRLKYAKLLLNLGNSVRALTIQRGRPGSIPASDVLAAAA